MPESSNENDPGHADGEPDAYGQAALMLCESILHALIETKAFSIEKAISVVRTAQELKMELAEGSGESRARMQQSLALLGRIAASLETDLN